jgi:hypothetical protein
MTIMAIRPGALSFKPGNAAHLETFVDTSPLATAASAIFTFSYPQSIHNC